MTNDDGVVNVSRDWVLGCDVQQRYIRGPGRNNGSVDLSGRRHPVRALGGDCYYFMPNADDRLAIAVGDASGNGLAAALVIAGVQPSLRTAALFTGNDLVALLKIVNRTAYVPPLDDRFATVFYGVFDRATRTLRYVNAGHNPPVVLRDDGSVHWLGPSGAPVGMFPDSNYREIDLQLTAEDLVIAYTDGVIEATNPGGEEWGVQGLLKATAAWEPQCSKGAEGLVL
jgi:phosphoserine phosphatase RsbU/P